VQQWAFQTSNDIVSSPLICSDGGVIVSCEDGNVYKVAGCTTLAESPWPMFHHDPQHTGSLAGTNCTGSGCETPFPNGGSFPNLMPNANGATYSFSFNVVGASNTSWSVYASTNLLDWTNTGSIITNDTNGFGSFADTNIPVSISNVCYFLSNGCCSRVFGFIYFNRVAGTNFVADPFYQVDDTPLGLTLGVHRPASPMNSVACLFCGINSWLAADNYPQISQGSTISTWINGEMVTDISTNLEGWSPNGDIELLPGVGALLDDTNNLSGSTDPEFAFFGVVPQAITNLIQPGINYLGSALPRAGLISTDLGYTNATAGDTLEKWDVTNGMFITYTNMGGSSWSNTEPYIGLAEGFILNSRTNHTWIQTCSPCSGN
jgi:hypothetical protein